MEKEEFIKKYERSQKITYTYGYTPTFTPDDETRKSFLSDLNEVIRGELIKYDNWITKGDSVVSSEEAVDDYIKFNTEHNDKKRI